MTTLLFPGRHLLQTTFQERYLRAVVQTPLDRLNFLPGPELGVHTPIDTIVFAITSANHQFTRYNPIPFHIRAIGVDRFASNFAADFGVRYRIFGIPHYSPSPRFAEILLKEIAEQTESDLTLSPSNTVILTSTLPIASMFQKLGFAILPAEAETSPLPATPQQLLSDIMGEGENWDENPTLRTQISPTTLSLWRDFPEVPRRIFRLWHDPLLTDDGSLTDTRDYATYARGMSNSDIIDLKYQDIQEHIQPGRIVDEGCADGALLVRIAADFPDSDLIGIEITGELLSRCLERQRAGEFGDTFVHFHQRNITTPIFQPASIHTTICNSTLHELWSYNKRETTVYEYLREKYRQLAPQGRLVIRDVVGADKGDEEVYLWLANKDGEAWNPEDVADEDELDVAKLSTYSRFFRFAQDFLPQHQNEQRPTTVDYRIEIIEGQHYIVTSKRIATEYITKKDYTDNWASEMHEEFAFWGFSEWKSVLRQVGFVVNPSSRTYTNEWIVNNRWQGKVALFRREDNTLLPLPYPPTTIVLVAEKHARITGPTADL